MSLIAIAQHDIIEYHGDRVPAFARLYANIDFRTSEGVFIAKGSIDHAPEFFQEFTASMSGDNIRIAAGNAYSTTDAVEHPEATYNLVIVDADGYEIMTVLAAIRIPPDDASTTWATIQAYSRGRAQKYPSTYLDSNAILALIAAGNQPLQDQIDILEPLVDKHLNGYASMAAAISGIGATDADLFVKEDITLNTTTIPENVRLVVRDGAVITVNGGQVLTVNSFQDPGNVQVFNAVAGGVLFARGAVERINVAWWCGNDATAVTAANFTAALNAALAVTISGSVGGTIFVPGGNWPSNGNHLVHPSTTIEGDTDSKTEITLQVGTDLFRIVGSDVIAQNRDIVFRQMALRGQDLAGSIGINFDNDAAPTNLFQISMENLAIWNFDTGSYLNGGVSSGQFAHIKIDNSCKISGSTNAGSKCVHLNSINMGLEYGAYQFVGTQGHGVYVEKAGNVVLQGVETTGRTVAYGTWQEIKQVVVAAAGITGDGFARCVVTGASIPNSPVTVDFAVNTVGHNTADKIAQAARAAIAKNGSIMHACQVGGMNADIVLDYLDPAANDATFNCTIENLTCTGITDDLTAVAVRAGAPHNAAMGLSGVTIAGPYGSIRMEGCQDEGLQNSIMFDFPRFTTISQRFTADNCLFQTPIRFNRWTQAWFNNCYFTNTQLFRAPSYADLFTHYGSEVFAKGCFNLTPGWFDNGAGAVSNHAIRKLSNFGVGNPVGGPYPMLVADYEWDGIADVPTTDRNNTKAIANQPTRWWTGVDDPLPASAPRYQFLANGTDKTIFRLGNAGTDGYSSSAYDFKVDGVDAYLEIDASHAPGVGPFNGVRIASNLSVGGELSVPDSPYGAGWNGSLLVPTRNAVYDQVEAEPTAVRTLTNKTIALGSNTLSGTTAQFNTALSDGDFATLAGAENLTNKTLITPTISGAISFPDDVRQTFNPGVNNAGLNVGSHAGDPSTPSNGDLWYDSTANELTARINGANVALGAGGGGGIGGSTGATDNAILRADGAGGSTLQTSLAVVDDSGYLGLPQPTYLTPNVYNLSDTDTGVCMPSNIYKVGFVVDGVPVFAYDVFGLGWSFGNIPIGWRANHIGNGGPDIVISRDSAGVLKFTDGTSAGGALQLPERTAPSSAPANSVRLYAEDNGSGKTRLMAIFPSGAAQQVAIEP